MVTLISCAINLCELLCIHFGYIQYTLYIIDIIIMYVCMYEGRGESVMFTRMYAADRSDERNGADMEHNEASKTVS